MLCFGLFVLAGAFAAAAGDSCDLQLVQKSASIVSAPTALSVPLASETATYSTEDLLQFVSVRRWKSRRHEMKGKVVHSVREAARSQGENLDGWTYRYLDEAEVARRGSFCIDGSLPGYFYKAGTSNDKWIISLEGGKVFCFSEEDCVSTAAGDYATTRELVDLSLFQSDAFKDFHMVQLHHCDGGLWMGERSEIVNLKGHGLYFRGRRILDHTFDALKANTTFGTATQVLLTGGSGGGQATYLLADYIGGLMPSSVKKYGAVPMSGWYTAHSTVIQDAYSMHGMQAGTAPGCLEAFSKDELYKCLEPGTSYTHSKTHMFVIQMLDSNSLHAACDDKSFVAQTSTDAWLNCLDAESPKQGCSGDDVVTIQKYLEDFVLQLQSIAKSSKKGEGGFISTCTAHVFYKLDEYFHYANGKVSVDDAVSDWWRSLGNSGAKPKWHLPCDLKTNSSKCQCEPSCAYRSASDPGSAE